MTPRVGVLIGAYNNAATHRDLALAQREAAGGAGAGQAP